MGKQGIALLEVTVIIGSIALLAVILIWIINPKDFLAEVRDSKKIAQVNQLQANLTAYLLEHLKAGCDSASSPLINLPPDFSYVCDSTKKTFELDVKMESRRYSQGGADDIESKDGGNQPNVYEVGNDLELK